MRFQHEPARGRSKRCYDAGNSPDLSAAKQNQRDARLPFTANRRNKIRQTDSRSRIQLRDVIERRGEVWNHFHRCDYEKQCRGGPPIDLLCYEVDSLVANLRMRLDEDDPYLQEIGRKWQNGIVKLVKDMPVPDFTKPSLGFATAA